MTKFDTGKPEPRCAACPSPVTLLVGVWPQLIGTAWTQCAWYDCGNCGQRHRLVLSHEMQARTGKPVAA